jgi:hypothetical protein
LAQRWRLGCQLYTPATLYPQKDLLVLISVRGCVNPRAIVQLEGLGKFKKCNDLIGIQISNVPACSITPQPFTLLCASYINISVFNFIECACLMRLQTSFYYYKPTFEPAVTIPVKFMLNINETYIMLNKLKLALNFHNSRSANVNASVTKTGSG